MYWWYDQRFNNCFKFDFGILSSVSITEKFMKNNPDILFTRANKGKTVALERTDYISKMENNLSNSNTYTLLHRNPVNKLFSYPLRIIVSSTGSPLATFIHKILRLSLSAPISHIKNSFDLMEKFSDIPEESYFFGCDFFVHKC